MYTIYSDDNLIYAPNLVDDGYYAIEPKLDMELNLASTFQFGLPMDAEGYDKVHKLKSIVKVYDGDRRIFRGRCMSDELNLEKQKDIYCEGELAFLQDSVIRAYTFTGTIAQYFTQLITWHNNQVQVDKRFNVGNITVGNNGTNTITRSSDKYPTTFDELNDQLIEQLGGYLVPRYEIENGIEVEYLDYLADSGGQNSQIIEFGNNLIDLSQKLDAREVFTVLIPLGKATGKQGGIERRLNIKSVNNNKDYLEDATAIAEYGRIYKSMVWDDEDSASRLKTRGQRALNSGANIVPQIELSAVDLHLLDADASAIELGEYNRVISLPHGIDAYFQCVRVSIDLENIEKSQYSFGATSATLTKMNNAENKKINAVISKVQSNVGDIEVIYRDVDTLTAKSDTIEEGAQVNKIEVIMINGTPVEITDKTVNITIPT